MSFLDKRVQSKGKQQHPERDTLLRSSAFKNVMRPEYKIGLITIDEIYPAGDYRTMRSCFFQYMSPLDRAECVLRIYLQEDSIFRNSSIHHSSRCMNYNLRSTACADRELTRMNVDVESRVILSTGGEQA